MCSPLQPKQEAWMAYTVIFIRGSRVSASRPLCLCISSFSNQPLLPMLPSLSVTSLACTLLLGWHTASSVAHSQAVRQLAASLGGCFGSLFLRLPSTFIWPCCLVCRGSVCHGDGAAHLRTIWRKMRWEKRIGGEGREGEGRRGERKEGEERRSEGETWFQCLQNSALQNFCLFQAILTSPINSQLHEKNMWSWHKHVFVQMNKGLVHPECLRCTCTYSSCFTALRIYESRSPEDCF